VAWRSRPLFRLLPRRQRRGQRPRHMSHPRVPEQLPLQPPSPRTKQAHRVPATPPHPEVQSAAKLCTSQRLRRQLSSSTMMRRKVPALRPPPAVLMRVAVAAAAQATVAKAATVVGAATAIAAEVTATVASEAAAATVAATTKAIETPRQTRHRHLQSAHQVRRHLAMLQLQHRVKSLQARRLRCDAPRARQSTDLVARFAAKRRQAAAEAAGATIVPQPTSAPTCGKKSRATMA